jgi:hypothetical protein
MSKRVSLLTLALCSVVSPVQSLAQQPQAQPSPPPQAQPSKPAKSAKPAAKKPAAAAAEADPMAEIRRTTAVSLVTTLADDARTFREPGLRARVQARAADALWETDREKSLALFRRAWDEAESADAEADRLLAEERRRQQRERGSFSVALPPSLRTEVLRLAAKRDRALGEEFLTKLDEARKRESESAATSNERPPDTERDASGKPQRPDPMETPPAVAKRLRLAVQLLDDGDVERAIQFADPALGAVTPVGLEFLARLRQKNAPAADERYAAMVARAAASPASDANTASLLSSYLFSPTLFMVFSASAGSNANSWGRGGPAAYPAPGATTPQLRAAYFRAASAILLRPTPAPEQDLTSSGRAGWHMVISRLLPLFDQYAPDRSAPLRAKMASLAPDTPDWVRQPGANNALTRGLVPEDPNRDQLGETLRRLEQAKTAEERDAVYVDAVFDAQRQKDPRVEEFLAKIEDADTRQRLRAYIDIEAARAAVAEKDVAELLRLARGNTLTSFQRVWALTEAARLVSKNEPGRAVELLDEAQAEAKERIDPDSKERVSALVAVATQLVEIDRARAWEVMLEVVKASNAAKDYTGEDGRLSTRFQSKNMSMMSTTSAQSFDLTDIFTKLAREDMQRAADLARTFEGESPRAFATLAVARTVLGKTEQPKPAPVRAAS